ncbi:MAG TPA: response regulator [Roseiarcus sp.]|nr:response regulator [Roseiarcus sp.]
MSDAVTDHRPPPETILFVEDEVLTRMDMAEFLRQSGYRVSEAASAAEAVDALSSKLAVDLVITDVRMPGDMDGLALAEWIKANRPGVEVIVTSGDALAKDVADQSLQFVAFLPKPYTGRALLDLVIQALAKRAPDIGGAAGAA